MKSKVPKRDYPTTLEEQLRALEEDPLIHRFQSSRTELARDPLRPAYHYVNPEGGLNDPNGLCFWHGRWHLFYQAYPPEDTRQHWGHAVSDDLIHWQDLPLAIYPDPENACFSGSILIEDGRAIAMYHGTQVGNMVAVSSDPLLLNWEKLGTGPVIPMHTDESPYVIYDPCIWRKGEDYYSLSGYMLPDGPGGKPHNAVFLFRSRNLIEWEYLHPFVEHNQYSEVGDDGACPYFWPIGHKHMLLYFSHRSGGKYLVGDYETERDKLVVTSGGDFNFGPVGPGGVHAPSAAPDGDDIIAIFNMNPGKPTEGWNQIMSLPRRLSINPDSGDGEGLHIEPAGDVDSLRGEATHHPDLLLLANQETVLEDCGGNTLEIHAVIEASSASSVEINVLRSRDDEEFTRILFYRDRGNPDRYYIKGHQTGFSRRKSLLVIDATYASVDPEVRNRPSEIAPFLVAEDEPVELRIFVDRSIVEVFANNLQCAAVRVYPSRSDSLGISLRSRGSDTRVSQLDVYQMDSIYQA
jgi:beta-fructofuranosidase